MQTDDDEDEIPLNKLLHVESVRSTDSVPLTELARNQAQEGDPPAMFRATISPTLPFEDDRGGAPTAKPKQRLTWEGTAPGQHLEIQSTFYDATGAALSQIHITEVCNNAVGAALVNWTSWTNVASTKSDGTLLAVLPGHRSFELQEPAQEKLHRVDIVICEPDTGKRFPRQVTVVELGRKPPKFEGASTVAAVPRAASPIELVLELDQRGCEEADHRATLKAFVNDTLLENAAHNKLFASRRVDDAWPLLFVAKMRVSEQQALKLLGASGDRGVFTKASMHSQAKLPGMALIWLSTDAMQSKPLVFLRNTQRQLGTTFGLCRSQKLLGIRSELRLAGTVRATLGVRQAHQFEWNDQLVAKQLYLVRGVPVELSDVETATLLHQAFEWPQIPLRRLKATQVGSAVWVVGAEQAPKTTHLRVDDRLITIENHASAKEGQSRAAKKMKTRKDKSTHWQRQGWTDDAENWDPWHKAAEDNKQKWYSQATMESSQQAASTSAGDPWRTYQPTVAVMPRAEKAKLETLETRMVSEVSLDDYQVPDGCLQLLFCNTGTTKGHLGRLLDLNMSIDLLALGESNHTEKDVRPHMFLPTQGDGLERVHLAWTPPVRAEGDCHTKGRASAGVMMAARTVLLDHPLVSEQILQLGVEGRCLLKRLNLHGNLWLNVYAIYAPVTRWQDNAAETTQFLQTLMAEVLKSPDELNLVVGDYNLEFLDEITAQAMQSRKWLVDIGDTCTPNGMSQPATFRTRSSAKPLHSFTICTDAGTGAHLPLIIALRTPATNPLPVLKQVLEIPPPGADQPVDKVLKWQLESVGRVGEYIRALDELDIGKAFYIWSSLWEQYLQLIVDAPLSWDKFTGRATASQQFRTPLKVRNTTQLQTDEERRLWQLLGIMQGFRQGRYNTNEKLKRKAIRLKESLFAKRTLPDLDWSNVATCSHLEDALRTAIKAERMRRMADRSRQWKEELNASNGANPLTRKMIRGAPNRLHVLQSPAVLRAIKRSPMKLPLITAEDVEKQIQGARKSAANGPD
eukprot:1173297-Amphidinium_carterae.3